MKPEIAKLWIKDLRSDEFEQCQGYLTKRTEDGDMDCCLGVLCKRAAKEGVELITTISDGIVCYNSREATPPNEVMIWAGLSGQDAEWFASLNDVDYATFNDIATVIEHMYLKGGENNNG
jgi:hypothetical protein